VPVVAFVSPFADYLIVFRLASSISGCDGAASDAVLLARGPLWLRCCFESAARWQVQFGRAAEFYLILTLLVLQYFSFSDHTRIRFISIP
jgi:hypothetical protein